VQSLPKRDRIPFSTKFKNADPLALDLLERMLVFDPRKRINATEALANEYLAPYHDPTDEPIANEPFDWSFNDADLPIDTWRVMMYSEILGTSTLFPLTRRLLSLSPCVFLPQSRLDVGIFFSWPPDFHDVKEPPAGQEQAQPAHEQAQAIESN
jgi:serine/threonine protein kinase